MIAMEKEREQKLMLDAILKIRLAASMLHEAAEDLDQAHKTLEELFRKEPVK